MSVTYISNGATWKLQKGDTSGPTEEGLFYYNLPYRGGSAGAEAFRQSWQRGDSCPIAGYDGLKLVRSPEIFQEGHGMANAILRFEGPDPNVDPGEDGENQEESETAQEREIILQSDAKKGTYMYLTTVVSRTYTSAAKRSTPKSFPTMDDPELKALVDFPESQKSAVSVADMITAHATNPVYKVEEVSGFTEKRSTGAGWVHIEWHSKILTAIAS